MYDLPKTIIIGGESHNIRYDFRPILDILIALEDNELNEVDKAVVLLKIFYVEMPDPQYMQEAIDKAIDFINLDQPQSDVKDTKRTLSFKQDSVYILGAVDKQLGFSCRRSQELHWWEFMGALMNVDECFLTHLVHQRKLKSEGKHDKKWWAENRHIAELQDEIQSTNDLLGKINGW